MIDLANLTIEKAHESLANGEYSVRDLAGAYLAAIEAKNGDIRAYLEVYDDVMAQADAAQKMFDDGTAGMLAGIPIALKDNMLVRGHVASASSKILEPYVAAYDATVVSKLKAAGAVLLGRTNMDEFAMGSSTENSAYGPTKNPADTAYVPGGSSGGAAAAVAMDGALVSLGSDTGGSIRQPASFCGVVGFKPTYGCVSRYGLIAMASSLDQIGPFAKTVRDAEILFEAIRGADPLDATTIPDADQQKHVSPLRKKIGIPRDFVSGDGIDPEVMKNFEASCKKLEDLGYELVDVSLPLARYSLPVYYIIVPAEVSSNLARLDGIRYGAQEAGDTLADVYRASRGRGFGKETRRRILLGTYILSHGYYDAYYGTAGRVQEEIKREFDAVFETVDAIVTPTAPFPPFRIGEKANDPLAMYLSDLFTVPANIAGLPAISVPSGTTESGLPLGIHFMAPRLREDVIFSVAKDFEKHLS